MNDADRFAVIRLFERAIRTRDSLAHKGIDKADATLTAWHQLKLDALFNLAAGSPANDR